MSARFTCCYCNEPLLKKNSDFTIETSVRSGIERAWHNKCVPNHAETDSPFQAAVQKAKQAIADARRLPEREREAFTEIVGLALTEQREEAV